MDKSDGSGWLPLSRRSALGTLAGAVGIGTAGCLFDNGDDESNESGDPGGGNESMSGEPPDTDHPVGDRQGIHALDANADRKRYRGYHVDHGCAVSVDSGDLDTEDTLSADAGRYFVAGEPQDIGDTSVGIGAAPSPGAARWDVVHGTADGIEITAGTEEGTRPSDAQRRGVERPAPPQVSGTVFAWIWVSSESGTITDDDVIDRRLFGHSKPASLDPRRLANPAGATGVGADRPMYSREEQTISVPGDYETIQAAIDDCPLLLNHTYTIEVDPANYTAQEDLAIPTLVQGDTNGDTPASSSTAQLRIESATDGTSYDLGSVYASGINGVQVSILDATLHNGTPYVDRDIPAVVVAGRIRFSRLSFEIDNPPIRAGFESGAEGRIKLQNGLDVGVGQLDALVVMKDWSVFWCAVHPDDLAGEVPTLAETGSVAIIDFKHGLGDLTVTDGRFDPPQRSTRYRENNVEYLPSYTVNETEHYARDDDELDAVLERADEGDTIRLGSALFSKDRTFDTVYEIEGGGGPLPQGGTRLDGATWTFDKRCELKGISQVDAASEIVVNGAAMRIRSVSMATNATISVNADRVTLTELDRGTVDFATGTADGIVDSSTAVTVNDPDGNNTTGTIG